MLRHGLAAVALLLITSTVEAEDRKPTIDEALLDLLRNRREMTDLMKATRTRKDAERVALQFDRYAARILEQERAMEQLEAELSPAEKKAFDAAMAKKYAAQYRSTNAEFMKALIRLEVEYPDAHRVLRENALLQQHRQACLQNVRKTIAALDRSVKAYNDAVGETPKSLKQAVESVYSLLQKESLQDPWGRPYQYDRDGKHNGGRKPDIFIVDPFDGKTLIGNWQK